MIGKLYQNAMDNDQAITEYAKKEAREYWAESFTARLLHPEQLEKRDPKMYQFATFWMKKKGIL